MNKHRIRKALLWLIGALACYALAGFFLVPAIVKSQATKHVEHELGHKLDLGEVRFNPFTLAAEVTGFDLKEASGATLVSFKRLFINFQTSSLLRRAWTFAALEVDAPAARFELRPDGSHNFSALLAKLRKPPPEPDSPVPRIEIDRIQVSDGRIDVADLQAGQDARLALHPITFELTELSTLPAETSPYKFVARSTDGEVIQWGGEITLNPFSSTGKLALQNWKLATFDRLLGNRVGVQSAAGQLGIVLDYRAAFAQGQTSVAVSNAQVTIDGLALSASAGVPPLISMQRFAASGGSFDLTQRAMVFERIELAQGAIDLNIDADGKPNWAALLPQPISHSAATAVPATASTPAPTTTPPAAASTNQPAAPWNIKLPQVVASEIAFAYNDKRAASATALKFSQGKLALAASAQVGSGAPTASIDNLSVSAAEAALTQPDVRLVLGAVDLSATQLKLAPKDDARQIDVDTLKLVAKAVTSQQGVQSARIDALDLSLQSAAVVLPAAGSEGVSLRLSSAALESKGIAARAGGNTEAVEIKALTVGAKQILTDPGSTLQIEADDLRAVLDGVLVRDPASNVELAKLGKLDVVGGTLSTSQQAVTLERVSVSDMSATAAYARDGTFNWDALVAAFAARKPVAQPVAETLAKAARPAETGWNTTVKLLDVNKLGAAFSDARQQPALALAIQDVNAKLRNASTQGKTPAGIELTGRIKDSGQFRAAGTVDLKTLAADLKLKLDGISLTVAQPFIAQRARLQLVSAFASAEGRLRYGKPKEAGAGIVYEGALGLDKVVLEETEPAQPFLSLDTLRASQVKLTLGPDSLDVPDLRLNRLATKLAIAEDQSVNLVKVLRAPPAETKSAATPSASAPAKPAPDDAEASFPISLARIRIDNSVLEFSDLSLRPQLFSTRMHELQGVITGVSTSRDSRARLELDARVDEFGAAIIRGAMNPFKPRVFTEVDLDFRNIAMTTLTPYSTKFAGYRIASGTLTMSLQYRVRNSVLQGNNKILLDKLELGERVESPTALNLPLELAIAILKDSDGRIDIGLPVSGSLEDPQFSLAGIVWKAIGNLLTRIVTAPFRALASLFGGGDSETLGAIEFDPGSEALRPPERQKLRTVAEALQKRQQLKLTVKPSYAANADREALKSLSVRRAVLTRAGIKLEPGESPGPLDVGNARMQQAIDTLYVERFGLPAARDLRASLTKSPPAQQQAQEAAKPPANPAGLQAIRVARAMSERLIETAQVSDAELAELGRQRGAAVLGELRDAGKIDPARLNSATPTAVEPRNGPVITDLDLSVAK